MCSKIHSGYFKNGIKDSIWTYYEPYSEMRSDSSNYFLAKTYRYTNGLPSLVSAWNKKGEMTVYEGNGIIINSTVFYPITTPYKNGLRNGFETSIKPNGDTAFIKKYDNDILIYEKLFVDVDIAPEDSSTYLKTLENYNREVLYPARSYLHTISAWKISDQLLLDTTDEIIDFSNPPTYYKEVRVVNNSLKNGYWAVYFENGIAAMEGNYLNGKQVGDWKWRYPNGKNRLIVNYDNNVWKHLDSTGKVVSNFKNEYITKIIVDHWILNDVLNNELKKKKITLTEQRNNQREYDYDAMGFLLDGKVKAYHSGDYQSHYIGNYILLGEHITLSIKDWESNTFKRYTYNISFDKKGNIILEK